MFKWILRNIFQSSRHREKPTETQFAWFHLKKCRDKIKSAESGKRNGAMCSDQFTARHEISLTVINTENWWHSVYAVAVRIFFFQAEKMRKETRNSDCCENISHLFPPLRYCCGSLPSASSAHGLAPPDASADPASPPEQSHGQNDSNCSNRNLKKSHIWKDMNQAVCSIFHRFWLRDRGRTATCSACIHFS